jgi:hypothetical protein
MNDKLILLLGLLFFAVGNPKTYELVDKLVPVMDSNGPTMMGVLLHAIVFCILVTVLTKNKFAQKLLSNINLK